VAKIFDCFLLWLNDLWRSLARARVFFLSGKKENMKKPTVVRTQFTRLAGAHEAETAVGVFQLEDLEDPEKFFHQLPRARRLGNLAKGHDREAWECRARALRVGEKPVRLFIWLLRHPKERAGMITGEDELQAGLAMQQSLYRSWIKLEPRAPPKNVDPDFYRRYLRSPIWQWVRKMKLREAKYTCAECGTRKVRTELEVHHTTYERLGRERLDDLKVLCWRCHDREHVSWSMNP